MCGIVGFLGYKNGIDVLYEGLVILQNRGYDSAGVSSIQKDKFLIHKYASTDISAFDLLKPHIKEHSEAQNCIGHSRWACTGTPSDVNSHPHSDFTGKFSLVHNGIIENYEDLKTFLKGEGVEFVSETDTEVIVNLIGYHYYYYKDVVKAINTAVDQLEGTWGLVIQCLDFPDKLFCYRHGSPLLIGIENDFALISSEQAGFARHVKNYISIDNNELVELEKVNGKIQFGHIGKYKIRRVKLEKFALSPDPYPHWTLKEINEQFDSSLRAMGMGGRLDGDRRVKLGGLDSHKSLLMNIDHLIILGCGTSYHAGLYSSDLLKRVSGFNTVQVFDGGDFSVHDIPQSGKTGLLFLSQSGETKDLHRCIDIGKEKDLVMIGIVNVVDSMIARDIHCGVYLNAGREVGVASTKCFTSQVIVLSLIACWFSQERNINELLRIKIIESLRLLPYNIKNVISICEDKCIDVARYIMHYSSNFILGRDNNKAIAMEGALKIKEIGYINSNGCSTACLKHGSYALLEPGFPVILLIPEDNMYGRNNSVGEELKARDSFVIAISDRKNINKKYDIFLKTPKNELFYGIVSNICLQLIAYHVARLKDNKIDNPRNLAKTVSTD